MHEKSPETRGLDYLQSTRGRLLAMGVATALSAMALEGVVHSERAEATSAPVTSFEDSLSEPNIPELSADFRMPGVLANTAEVKPSCSDFPKIAVCYWKVRKVDNVPGVNQHPWTDCVRFKKSRLVQHITCSIAKSKSNSVTAEVGGKVTAKLADISSKVGYNVTKTTTLTTSDTVDVPKRTSGTVQWAAVYGNRKRVTQEYMPCFQTSPGYFDRCVPQVHPKGRNLAYAYTEKYNSPVFRVITNK